MFGYPPEVRIRTRRRYLDIQNGGRRINTRHFIVFMLPGQTERCRLGITASRRVGNSVHRNRWKRIMREAFRQVQNEIHACIDMVFIVRRGVGFPTSLQARHEILIAANKWIEDVRAGS